MDSEKLWRFRAVVLPELDVNIHYRWENPVPILLDSRIVGFAALGIDFERVVAWCATEYSIPTRLDVETDVKVWLLPKCNVELVTLTSKNKNTILTIESLSLQYGCTNEAHPPIQP